MPRRSYETLYTDVSRRIFSVRSLNPRCRRTKGGKKRMRRRIRMISLLEARDPSILKKRRQEESWEKRGGTTILSRLFVMDRRITNLANSPFRESVCALLPQQQFSPLKEKHRAQRRLASSVFATDQPIFVYGVRAEHVAISNLLVGGVEAYVCDSFFSYTHRVAPRTIDTPTCRFNLR